MLHAGRAPEAGRQSAERALVLHFFEGGLEGDGGGRARGAGGVAQCLRRFLPPLWKGYLMGGEGRGGGDGGQGLPPSAGSAAGREGGQGRPGMAPALALDRHPSLAEGIEPRAERRVRGSLREREHLLELRDVGAPAEVVKLVVLDLVEDLLVDEEGRPDGPPGIAVEVVDARLGDVKVLPRALDLHRHERLPPVVNLAGGAGVEALEHLILRDAVGSEVLLRDVDAVPLVDVLADIAQDVCQLVRGPQRQGCTVDRLELALIVWVNAHHGRRHEGDRARHHVAVPVQLVKRGVSPLHEVEPHPIYHVPERLDVERELGYCVGEGSVKDVVWLAREERLEPFLPSV
mmetsp:Transcript_17049/g.40674  ORF Transcript_17049/g.40674 Transcript_17049/m.40674 type:complete len:346 (-) Transcript_17049:573-1610(-)